MSRDAEANFTQPTKDLLASRAGYRCSFPTCGRSTIGPGAQPDKFASIGVASHIYSAAPGGPRGNGGLTNAQLADVSNGIWLCQDHSKLIDTNEGARFPAVMLQSYKGLHEARILRDMSGMRLSSHWVEQLNVQASPIKITDQKWVLGKVNLLLGSNTSGKSALCEWLGGQVNRASLRRWRPGPLRYQVTFFDPERHDVSVEMIDGAVSYVLDGRAVPINPLPIRVSWALPARFSDEDDHVAAIARSLGEDRSEVIALLEHARTVPNRLIADFEIVQEDKKQNLNVKVTNGTAAHPMDLIGGGALAWLLIELAAVRATVMGEHSPTLLIVDEVFSALDPHGKEKALGRIFDPNLPFQSIVTLPMTDKNVDWKGVSIAELQKDGAATVIRQPN
ncbi:uncharacterized protein SOCE26_078930 [Sorangium cellulosum]|uniref:Rad50/SbcC-type AAA domain-containing protein n=1 Tax=Sorangium cellulosum TaxID=56 RepID=A0A2L0F4C9_SORCE|nr:hypothetical protein [Sorangium cellulosum]AUX46387.1 uncharacterized protein SOCE26_078930 [Sorangium cellulosum]